MKRDKRRVKTHRCRICGAYGVTQIHHVFGGARRRISERENFVIELCPACHSKAHNDASFGNALKHDCQLEYLEEHTFGEWMELMGKSWIEEAERRELYKTPCSSCGFEDYLPREEQ